MKFLQCLICDGELDIINHHTYIKQVSCRKCGYKSENVAKSPNEVEVIKRRPIS